MKWAFFYLIVMLATYCALGFVLLLGNITLPNESLKFATYCGLCGGIGGITYCLRGIYINACVNNRWNDIWLPWYFIRPIVSFVCGVISCLFLKAGLIVLEAQQATNSTNLTFFALAFIAGLNVDKFIEKIEDIAQVTWGIKKSRISSKED